MTLDELRDALPKDSDIQWGATVVGTMVVIMAERGEKTALKSVSTIHIEQYRDIAVQDIVRDLARALGE